MEVNMPVIFDEEKRERIRETLLENGFKLIRKFGMKKTSVEEISKASGIAKGTFYNFFKSKEDFVAEIIVFKRNKFKRKFSDLVNAKGNLSRPEVQYLLEEVVNSDESLYPYLTEEDIAIISTRVPGFIPKEENVRETTNLLLSYIPDKSPDCDWRVVANYLKIIALTEINKNMLIMDAVPETLNGLISITLNEIFKDSAL
jgi:AcrR family transcriptional regulator